MSNMQIFIEFYVESATDQKTMIRACGSDSVYIPDQRLSLANKIETGKKYADRFRVNHIHDYKAMRVWITPKAQASYLHILERPLTDLIML